LRRLRHGSGGGRCQHNEQVLDSRFQVTVHCFVLFAHGNWDFPIGFWLTTGVEPSL
jgi:mannose/cellobiose epimerase-like protein (N-acyl-D-glucosamine 2-epimerase family)